MRSRLATSCRVWFEWLVNLVETISDFETRPVQPDLKKVSVAGCSPPMPQCARNRPQRPLPRLRWQNDPPRPGRPSHTTPNNTCALNNGHETLVQRCPER